MSEENATETSTNLTESFKEAEQAEEEHEFDAISALALNVAIIGCLLLAYFVKKFRIYYLPERYVRMRERRKTASFGSFTTVCAVM
jgi:hypothetical protein